jgi:hypothetical protein
MNRSSKMKISTPESALQQPAHVALDSSPTNHLRINIDRITLHGYASADQGRFTRALSGELTKLADAYGDVDWNKAAPLRARISRLDAGELRAGASAEDAARHVAQNIFEKLTQHRTKNRGSENRGSDHV